MNKINPKLSKITFVSHHLVSILVIICVVLIIFQLSGCSKLDQSSPSNPAPGQQASSGKCGDDICDDVEKASGKCQEDCKEIQSSLTSNQNSTSAEKTIAQIYVDYSADLGAFNKYLFTIPSPPYYVEDEPKAAAEMGYKVQEIMGPSYMSGRVNADFSLIDKLIKACIDNGMEPKIVLSPGEALPENITEYREFLEYSILHLIEVSGGKIKVLRFFNEPDNKGFWKDSNDNYFIAYKEFETIARKYIPSVIIDAPAVMAGTKRAEAISQSSIFSSSQNGLSDFSREFLENCKQNGSHVDYFSAHGYSFLPYFTYYADFKVIKNELDKYPKLSKLYGVPKLANNEWNYMLGKVWSGTYNIDFDTTWGASSVIISFINMIEAGLEMSTKLGGITNEYLNPTSNYFETKECLDFPLWDCENNAKPMYYALKTFNNFSNTMRVETLMHNGSSRHMNFGVLAGKNSDELLILAANFDARSYVQRFNANERNDRFRELIENEFNSYALEFDEPELYDRISISINNLPNEWLNAEAEVFLIDDHHNTESISKQAYEVSNGSILMNVSIDIPSVLWIKIKKF